jgi:hypothetical protein
MSDTRKRPGRPATGQAPLRRVRVEDELWTEVETMAAALAKHMGFPKANVSAYIRQALVMENARVTKLIAKKELSK